MGNFVASVVSSIRRNGMVAAEATADFQRASLSSWTTISFLSNHIANMKDIICVIERAMAAPIASRNGTRAKSVTIAERAEMTLILSI